MDYVIYTFDSIIIILLIIECWIIYAWSKEHAEILDGIKKKVNEIKNIIHP